MGFFLFIYKIKININFYLNYNPTLTITAHAKIKNSDIIIPRILPLLTEVMTEYIAPINTIKIVTSKSVAFLSSLLSWVNKPAIIYTYLIFFF